MKVCHTLLCMHALALPLYLMLIYSLFCFFFAADGCRILSDPLPCLFPHSHSEQDCKLLFMFCYKFSLLWVCLDLVLLSFW